MDSMFSLVSSFGGGSKATRDEYGIGDLLAQVSKRSSSISTEERQEISDMTRRLRGHKPISTLRETPNNSAHDGMPTPSATTPPSVHGSSQRTTTAFGKDLLKVDLFRGFGSSTNAAKDVPQGAPLIPSGAVGKSAASDKSNGVLLRGFGPSIELPTDSGGDDSEEGEEDFAVFEGSHKL